MKTNHCSHGIAYASPCWRCDALEVEADRFERQAAQWCVGHVSKLLRKLPVADLRVLARKYYRFNKQQALELSKGELVFCLAHDHGEDLYWAISKRS